MEQKRIELYLLWKCTNDCIFCIETERKQKYWNRIFSFEYVSSLLEKESRRGANHVTFLGGEPTLHPNFLEILMIAKRLGYSTSITTNSALLASINFVRKIRPFLDEIIISIHGHNAEIHEKNTQRKGSFKILKSALKNLSNIYGNLLINTVISKYNFRYLINIIRFIERFNINKIHFSAIELPKRVNKIISSVPNLNDVKPFLLNALDYADSKNIIARTADIPLCFLDKHYLKSDDFFYTNRVKIENDKRLDRSQVPPRKKIKLEKCDSCKLNMICGGILRGYYKIFKYL